MKTRLKLTQINFENIEKKGMKTILGGTKVCYGTCDLGYPAASGQEYAHNRLNPPKKEEIR